MNVHVNLRAHLSASGTEEQLRRVIAHFADSAKYIAYRMGESNRKLAGTVNAYGEAQLELDLMSDEILLERLNHETSFGICEFASEEREKVLPIYTKGARYSIAVDPLDGSSLVDVNLAVGTLIGIFEGPILSGKPARETMCAAIYILYGPLTTLIYTVGKGVHEFVMDPTGSFVLTSQDVKMKEKGDIYAPGGLKKDWLPQHAAFVQSLEDFGYRLRYSGGFVPDINQILIKRGGIFTYPALVGVPDGKLRLLFELLPMAMLVSQAGGGATNGTKDLLDLVVTHLEQRSPVYIGSNWEVARARHFLGKSVDEEPSAKASAAAK